MLDESIGCEQVDGPDGRTLIVRGEIDLEAARYFRAELASVIAADGSNAFVDLSGVRFMDSTGIGALLDAQHGLPAGKRLVLVDPSPCCDLVFAALGLTEHFETLRT